MGTTAPTIFGQMLIGQIFRKFIKRILKNKLRRDLKGDHFLDMPGRSALIFVKFQRRFRRAMEFSIRKSDIPIPRHLNIVIALISSVLAVSFLFLVENTPSWWGKLLWAIAFSYVGNTLFSLLHESVHRIFHPNKSINDLFGSLTAAFFPTGFNFQRAFHLGHHRRNRTDVEMFDMYYPSDNRVLKFLQLYTVVFGFYWTAAPLGGILYLISPRILNLSLFRSQHKYMKPMSMEAMLSGLDRADQKKIRLELLFTLLFQLSLFYFLNLSFTTWILCYWAFAINWGSMQYADHAWSERDIRNGAWNLRVNPLVRWIFLNYHHHLAHHQYPYVPWIHLGRYLDPTRPRPTHWNMWLRLFLGPTPTQEASPKDLSGDFVKVIYQGID